MSISPNLTFNCAFAVEQFRLGATEGSSFLASATVPGTQGRCWLGSGEGQTVFGKGEGLVGPTPIFKLCNGWFTLMPSRGFQQTFPARYFSDNEVHELDNSGEYRDLSSFSVLVGEALDKLLQVGDTLKIERNGNGHFRYAVARDSEVIFSAGSVAAADTGGSFSVWQEYDRYPNTNAEELKREFPKMPIAQEIRVHRDYVTARVNDRVFRLSDNDEVKVPPYFIFLARSNKNVPVLSFEFTPRAVHAAGRMDLLGKEWIIAAARQQTAVRVRML